MSDEVKKEHWAKTEANRKRFWAEAHALGFDNDEVHKVLEVDSLYDWTSTGKNAIGLLKARKSKKEARAAAEQRAERTQARAEDEPRLQGAVSSFPSLPLWASTEFVEASNFKWKICIAAGLQSDLRVIALEQVQDGMAEFNEMAACHGWKPANGYRVPPPTQPARPASTQVTNNNAPAPDPQPQSNGPPKQSAPPPPPPGQGAPPAPATEQAQNGGTSDGGELMTEFVKVVAPKGKPVIEFWRPNRQYAEIQYHLSAESLLALAPTLVEAGWVVAHFEDVGKEYALPLVIEWIPSPKNPKWKDITAVRLRQ